MKISFMLFLCLLAAEVVGQITDTLQMHGRIDPLVASLSRQSPGGIVLITRSGRILYEKTFGVADLELGTAMGSDAVFRIGSITKQFTACAILRLAEKGQLSLQENLAHYIKDYPRQGQNITIEHLLTHTSGIKNITSLPSWTVATQRKDHTPDEVIELFKNEPLDFHPGSKHQYSNSNYILLGRIIELVSGLPYARYMEENIFKPLHMNHSGYDDFGAIIPGRSKGYRRDYGKYTHADFISMTLPLGAGGLLSSARDLSTWYTALMHDSVINKTSRLGAWSPFRLSSGEEIQYGYGWELGNIQGLRSVSHSGKINGFLTHTLYIPDENVLVIVLTNCDCTSDIEKTSAQLAAIAVNRPFEWNHIVLSSRAIRNFEGVYISGAGEERVLSLEGGRLLWYPPKGMKTELMPCGNDAFHPDNTLTTIQFHRNKQGKPISFTTSDNEGSTQWSRTTKAVTKFKIVKVPAESFDAFVGKYKMGSGYFIITREADKLFGTAPGSNQVRQQILPYSRNQFFARNIDAQVRFNDDGNGNVISLTLTQGGEKTLPKVE